MENLEIRGKTVEEAIQHALDQLGLSREEIEVTVVKEGKGGILGLGAEEAVIRVKRLAPEPSVIEATQPDITESAQEVLTKLLDLMGVAGTITSQTEPVAGKEGEAAPPTFNIEGEDLGILIGRQGQTLASLQYIVGLIVSHQAKTRVRISIDVEGYKQRRYRALQAFAEQMAEQVKAKGSPFTLEPMSAYERRIIHLTLANHPDVTTQSIDEGEARKVVIVPKNK